MGACCATLERVGSRYPILAKLGDLKIAFVGLTSYIVFAMYAVDTWVYNELYHIWGPLPWLWLNILGVLALGSLYKTKMSDPGYVHEDWDANVSPEGMSDWGLCKTCKLTLPARAFHCRQANKCVLKYDHFCPWADNPVGYFNYKQYFLLLCYGVWSTGMIIIGSLQILQAIYITKTLATDLSVMFWVLLFFTLVVFISLFPLWWFHLRLIRLNLSTKEWYTQLREENQPESGSISSSKWNLGLRKNIEQSFGPIWWQWWNPWVRGPTDSGTAFPKSPDFKRTVPGISAARDKQQ